VFVPGAAGGRYAGTFFWSEQANARWRRFSLDPVQPAIAWGTYAAFPSGCSPGGDLSDGYYDVAQAVVAAKDSKLSKETTISGLKGYQFGAQVGTTSLNLINTTIAPRQEAKVYDTNDLAIEALKNGQIDGLVVDLPTALYITAAQFEGGVIAGQFPAPEGGEHFSVVLDKDSPLTECVNRAIGQLRESGELARIVQEELSDNIAAPVYQP